MKQKYAEFSHYSFNVKFQLKLISEEYKWFGVASGVVAIIIKGCCFTYEIREWCFVEHQFLFNHFRLKIVVDLFHSPVAAVIVFLSLVGVELLEAMQWRKTNLKKEIVKNRSEHSNFIFNVLVFVFGIFCVRSSLLVVF